MPEDEIRALLDGDDPEPWLAFCEGMQRARRLLDGEPQPTHRTHGHA